MDIEELQNAIRESVYKNFYIIQKTLPYKTGNLAYNAFKIKDLGNNKFDILIDLNIAPYAEYINRPGYRTAGYWEQSMRTFINAVAKDLGGTL